MSIISAGDTEPSPTMTLATTSAGITAPDRVQDSSSEHTTSVIEQQH